MAAEAMTQAAYAHHRGVVRQQVSAWRRAGRIAMVHGRVDVAASDAMLDGPPVEPEDPGELEESDPSDWAAGAEVAAGVTRTEAERQRAIWQARRLRLHRPTRPGGPPVIPGADPARMAVEARVAEIARILARAALNWLQKAEVSLAESAGAERPWSPPEAVKPAAPENPR